MSVTADNRQQSRSAEERSVRNASTLHAGQVPGGSSEPPEDLPGEVLEAVQMAMAAARSQARHTLALIAAEAEVAGRSASAAFALSLLLAGLLLSGWLLLIATGVWLAIAAGVMPAVALLCAAVLQLGAAAFAWWRIGAQLRELTWPRTRAQLGIDDGVAAP